MTGSRIATTSLAGDETTHPRDLRGRLQQIVDELGIILDASVEIRVPAESLRVASQPPSELGGQHIDTGHDGDRTDLCGPEFPVRGSKGLLGHLVIDGRDGARFRALHYQAIEAGVTLARQVIEGGAAPTSDRLEVVADLLGEDASARRAALATAVGRRWLPRLDRAVVWAVLVDSTSSTLQRFALGRYIATVRSGALFFAGQRHSILFFVDVEENSLSPQVIRAEAAQGGVRVLGIGCAAPGRGVDDLAEAAAQAAVAADLSATIPEFQPFVHARDLGGWMLIAAADITPAGLRSLSPSAHALCFESDQSQRRTIETYLDVGANVAAACQVLYIHRTTLYYRLEKMPEVVRDALADGMKRSTLHLALKLIRLWEAQGRI